MGNRPSRPSTDVQIQAQMIAHIRQYPAAEIPEIREMNFADIDEEIRVRTQMIAQAIAHIRQYSDAEIPEIRKMNFAYTDEGIRVAAERVIKTNDIFNIFRLLETYFSQRVQLPDDVIRTIVKKLIESIGTVVSFLDSLLKNHFAQKIQLTNEEIVAIVKKLLYEYDSDSEEIKQLVAGHFPQLTQVQIVIFAKEIAPDRMTIFLADYSQALDENQFQWVVEGSLPRCIRLFWKKYPTTLSQEKLIIVEKKVIDDERHKLIAILKAVSKDFGCFQIFVEYLVLAPWQDLKYLLPESDV
jgi:hypothetical protein